MAITQKAGQFRDESRFTTWAYTFVVFEVSAKLGCHFWRHPTRPLDAESWDRLPDRFGFDPARESEWRDLRYPGIAAHLRACGPCGEDFEGLLAAIAGEAP